MSKANGAINSIGKVITYLVVVLLVLGIAGGITYFVLQSDGITYYVEYSGQQYFGNGEGGSLILSPSDEPYIFSVKSLLGEKVNYDVKVVANSANNFTFTCDNRSKEFYSNDATANDYSTIFGLKKSTDGFSITIANDLSLKKAIELKHGENCELPEELDNNLCYFAIVVTAEDSKVNLWFTFDIKVTGIVLDTPEIVF